MSSNSSHEEVLDSTTRTMRANEWMMDQGFSTQAHGGNIDYIEGKMKGGAGDHFQPDDRSSPAPSASVPSSRSASKEPASPDELGQRRENASPYEKRLKRLSAAAEKSPGSKTPDRAESRETSAPLEGETPPPQAAPNRLKRAASELSETKSESDLDDLPAKRRRLERGDRSSMSR